MKKLILVAGLLCSLSAAADWQKDLADYQQYAKGATTAQLLEHYAGNATLAIGSCSAGIAITAATIYADTYPGYGVLSSLVAKGANPDYQLYNSLLSWETLGQVGRKAAGGAAMAGLDGLRAIELWLAGDATTDRLTNLRAAYASAFATADALFSQQSECGMSVSKIIILRNELHARVAQMPDIQLNNNYLP